MTRDHDQPAKNGGGSPPCRHCHVRKGRVGRNASRGLCNVCYWDIDIRNRYPKGRRARIRRAACLHCGEVRRIKSRRLCGSCYERPAVRAAYPAYAGPNKGHGCEGLRVRPGKVLPAEPTTALPGTPEKVEVLRQRASRGEQLHHPGDVKLDAADVAVILEAFGSLEAYQMKARPRREYGVVDD